MAIQAIDRLAQLWFLSRVVNTDNSPPGLERPFASNEHGQDNPFPQHLKALADCSPDAIFITDFDSARFVDANRNACTMFGYTVDEFRQMTGRQLHDKADSATVDGISEQLIANNHAFCPLVRLRRKDGSHLWAELRSRVYNCGNDFYVVFIRDLSGHRAQISATMATLKRREAQLVQLAERATIGSLATSIVHEVNNPTAILQMNVEVLGRRLDLLGNALAESNLQSDSEPRDTQPSPQSLLTGARENLSESSLAVGRISSAMRSLARVSKSSLGPVVRVSLNEVVQEAHSIMGARLRQRSDLSLRLGQPHYFWGYQERWLLLLINLLLNAHEALEGATQPGKITILTARYDDQNVIEVADNGPGISEELSLQVFEPFVTTRESQGAVGLGLASCVEIARQHGATMTLIPGSDRGVRIRVVIPDESKLHPLGEALLPEEISGDNVPLPD